MQADQVFTDVNAFALVLRELHAHRRGRVVSGRSERTQRALLTRQIAAKCWPRQPVVATSAAGSLMLMIGKRTTFWRTALAARTQSIIIFRPIQSATITVGITTLRNFNGYSSSGSG